MTADPKRQTPLRALALSRVGVAIDLSVMALAGLFFAAIGPFDTSDAPAAPRSAYWIVVMVVGGLVVLSVEAVVHRIRRLDHRLARMLAVTILATPVQTGVVMTCGSLIFGYRARMEIYVELLPAVLIVTLVAVLLLELVRLTRVIAPVGVEATAPSGEAASRAAPMVIARHLPARLRPAALIALQAEDHYVRVHTKAGSDLVLMRFSDAVEAAEAAQPGFRLHRSWWASAAALEAVSYKRGSGEARLDGGLTAPVSRTYYPALREAGWF